MKSRAAVISISALTLFACTRTVQDPSLRASAPSPKARRQKAPPGPDTAQMRSRPVVPKTGTRDTLDRQILNAVDAGDGDLRVRTYRERLATDPGNLQARLDIANYYKSHGFPEIALEHYRLAAGRFPDNAQVAMLLANSLVTLGFRREAREGLQKFVSDHPNASADAWNWLGIFKDDAGELQSAEADYRAALKLGSGSDAIHNNLGYNLMLQGKYGAAATEFRQALKASPGSAVAKNNLAMALAGNDDAAVQKELKATGDPAAAHNNLGAFLIEHGKYEAAHKELDLALGYNKYHLEALSNLRLLGELEGRPGPVSLGSVEASVQRAVKVVGDVILGPKADPKAKQSTGNGERDDRPNPAGGENN